MVYCQDTDTPAAAVIWIERIPGEGRERPGLRLVERERLIETPDGRYGLVADRASRRRIR